jgi:adenylylsulfate kinase
MSWAIWITGPPGSGKSVLARKAAEVLAAEGRAARVLELDEVRQTITPHPTYSADEREVVYRALVLLATELVAVGTPVVIDATAHRRAWRDLARGEIERFAEIQLECPVEVCQARARARRDSHAPRDVYAAAGRPGATVPGVDVPYEPAIAPELRLRTDVEPLDGMVRRVVEVIDELSDDGRLDHAYGNDGAIWITGRPGTGKTTLARALAESLSARGVRARLLTLGDVEERIEAHRVGRARGRELANLVLAYAARVLGEEGVLVVVDAGTGPRAWRELARKIVPRFVEVQLICPAEICEGRERAARWGLWPVGGSPGIRTQPGSPDTAPEHEDSISPDVVIHTGVQDVATAVQDVLRELAHFARTRLDDGAGGRGR